MVDTEKQLTGYPSVDKPWLKYYSNQQINEPLPECSLYEYLWECNKNHLDEPALSYFGKKITYRRLFSMIDKAARAFSAIGIKEKEIVPIISVSTVTSIVCFYALNRICAVSDYVNVLSEENDFQGYFKEANAKVVITLDLFCEKVVNAAKKSGVKTVIIYGINNEMPQILSVGYWFKTIGKQPVIPDSKSILLWNNFIKRAADVKEIKNCKDPDDMCLLAHTGGTTGTPKAVMLNDKAMNAVVCQYINVSGINRGEVFLNLIIPFVVYGILTNVHLPLCIGLHSVIIPKFDANDWGKYLRLLA